MAYVLYVVNEPYYDLEEMMPTPLGFMIKGSWVGGPGGVLGGVALDLRGAGKPLPVDLITTLPDGSPRVLEVEGYNAMPDIFAFGPSSPDFIVSDQFRAVLEPLTGDAVQYIEVPLRAPAHMPRADHYYFINVLGRGQRIDWSKTKTEGPFPSKLVFAVNGSYGPDYAMTDPPPDQPQIWHEVDLLKDGITYQPDKKKVFLSSSVARKLILAFGKQIRIAKIRDPNAPA
jgi:hypothetical protein